MTARKPKAVDPEEEVESVDQTEGIQTIDDADALRRLLERFGTQSITVKVSRATDKGAEYCFTTNDTDIDEGYIQEFHGPGVYNLRVFIDGDFYRTVVLRIAEARGPSVTKAEPPRAAAGSDPGLLALQAQLSSMTDLFKLMLMHQQAPAAAPASTPISELVGALAAMDQLRGGGEKEGSTEAFLRGIEFSRENAPGGPEDWKTTLVRSIKDVGPQLLQAINQPVAAQPGAPAAMTQAQQEWEAIRGGIEYLKGLCISGSDSGLIIDWVIANANNETGKLFIRLACSEPFAKFAEVDPGIGTEPFVSWFKAVYDGIRSEYLPADPVGDDPGGESGDDGNPGPDAEPSTGGGPVLAPVA